MSSYNSLLYIADGISEPRSLVVFIKQNNCIGLCEGPVRLNLQVTIFVSVVFVLGGGILVCSPVALTCPGF